MQRKFYALSILLFLFFVHFAAAQIYYASPDGLRRAGLNGSGSTHLTHYEPTSVLGKNTVYLKGTLYLTGINVEGGSENQESGVVSSTQRGTVFEINGRGIRQLHQFRAGTDDPANTTLFTGPNDELYFIGPYITSTGARQYQIGKVGTTTSARILIYGFRPNEILSTYEYWHDHPGEYGTSHTGGNNNAGFFFKVNSAHTGIQILYHFKKETGSFPVGQLTRGEYDGYLYGVTKTGGQFNYGVLFKIRPDGTGYEAVHHFNKTDGAYPDRGLSLDNQGFLWGTTSKGGAQDKGVLFAMYHIDNESAYPVRHFASGTSYPSSTYKIEQSILFSDDGLYWKNDTHILHYNGGDIVEMPIATKAFTISYGTYPDNTLVYPADGATNIPVNATFRTDTLDGAINYSMQLSTAEGFETIAATYQSTTPSFQVQGLRPGTKYYARYKTSFYESYGARSSFTTSISTTAGPSVVTTPANGATNVEAPTLKVTVKAVTGATRYTVEISHSSTFSSGVKSVTSSVDNQRTLTFTGLLYNTLYYARVKTNNNSNYGAVTSFRTKQQVFSKVISPVAGAVGVEFNAIKVTVQSISQAKRYTLELNTNSTFTGNKIIYTSLGDGQTSFFFRDLAPNTTYFTRVKADVNTTWGPTVNFKTRESSALTRIWGTTGANETHGGTLFSFSLDSLKLTTHQQLPVSEGFGRDLELGPDGIYSPKFSSPFDAGYHAKIFRYTPKTGITDESAGLTYSEDVRLMMASSGQLYASVDAWETAGKLVRVAPDLNSYKEIYFFKNATGREPLAPLTEVDGWMYSTTHDGGQFGFGTVYKVRPDGSNYTVLYHFSSHDLWFPRTIVYGNDGFLYGTLLDGPDDASGGVFRISKDGTQYNVLHIFYQNEPHFPEGDIIVRNGVVYGVTAFGGPSLGGSLFRINTDGTGFRNLVTFHDAIGNQPNGGLVLYRDGYLYGTTNGGGANNQGVIFRVKTDGTSYKKLYDFSGGRYPGWGLLVLDDTFTPPSAASATVAGRVSVQVYPNPTTDAFLVTREVPGSSSMYVELADFSGNVIHKSTVGDDGLEIGRDLPRGIYVLKVMDGKTVTTHRLVKK